MTSEQCLEEDTGASRVTLRRKGEGSRDNRRGQGGRGRVNEKGRGDVEGSRSGSAGHPQVQTQSTPMA